MRTLVIHSGGIGDFLLFSPTLKYLAREGSVELAGNTERLGLAVDAGLADAVHDIDNVDFASIFSTPSDRLRAFLARFQRAIVWMRDETGDLAEAVRECGVARVDCFPGIPPADWTAHASAWYAQCLGLPAPPPLHLAIERTGKEHDVIIHPGSGGLHKNWPLHLYLALAARLRDRGREVVWSLGPAERERTDVHGLTPTLDMMPLAALARVLAAARIYVGNDCGITHLAAAVGCPTIAVFGPTNPQVWAPLGGHVCTVHDAEWPTIDAVISAIAVASVSNI